MPTFAGLVTATPPARAPEPDAARRTLSSSSRPRSRRRDRDRVDVSLPRQRVPQPPPLRLERGERPLHFVLRAGADSTTTNERKPVPSVETEPNGHEEQRPGERDRSGARDHEPEQGGDDASERRLAGVGEPAILLATRVVHAATAASRGPQPDALWLALSCAIARSLHRRQTARTRSTIGPRFDPFSAVPGGGSFCSLPPNLPPKPLFAPSKVRICREKASTATGIRTRVPP